MSTFTDEFSFEHPDNQGCKELRRLSSGDAHFLTIRTKFYGGWKHPKKPKPVVHAIYKILSSETSLKPYHQYRALVTSSPALRKRTENPANEQFLFHGTNRYCRLVEDQKLCLLAQCSLCNIIRNSFDVGKCGTKHEFGRFGTGIYTSACSSKADDYVWNGNKALKFRVLLVSRVIVGNPHKRQQDATKLTEPPRDYHSVIGEPGVKLNYEETVVYDNAAIRPAFLVVYYKSLHEGACIVV